MPYIVSRLFYAPSRRFERLNKVFQENLRDVLHNVFVGIIYFMPFEYDSHKSVLNRAKHGIDFDEAQRLWDDELHLEVPAKKLDEPRFLVIGTIAGKHWSAVITYRGESIRIISVRRSRDEEIELYENESL